MSGRASARQLVEEISKKHGHVPAEILDRMAPEVRQTVLLALQNKDALIASSVMTLATNLYTSNARCVFELLQNADDNQYSEARKHNEQPFVSFRLYPDRIVVECNEDGFTRENLVAICNVGKSSKKGAQGYIGEKGIGFKSVFMAAYKAYIQSGHFSFYFQHRVGDSGMGMITPIWQDSDGQVEPRLTRITLSLHDDGDGDATARRRQTIRQQFEEIQGTMLLFLKNLEKIQIAFHDDGSETATTTTTYTMSKGTASLMSIKKAIFQDGKTSEDVKYYHTTRHTATNLAKNENRTYSEQEEATKAYSRGEVVLAFPLTADSTPIIDNQWVFAFLPVRQIGFKFLIQADFVTQANRQDIVTSSLRNEGFLRAIAEAFVAAVRQFSDHQTLQYHWMRYLPERDHVWTDSFGRQLVSKIAEQLSSAPVFRTNLGALRSISEVRRLTSSYLDQHGQPLLKDISPERYLSLEYENHDLNVLKGYGLTEISLDIFLSRVEADLRSPTSRIRTSDDQDWHSRVAKLLRFQVQLNKKFKEKPKELSILPLSDGQWVSAIGRTVYLPHVGPSPSLKLPVGVVRNVIEPAAIENSDREALFRSLGVKAPSVSFIRDAILGFFRIRHPSNGLVAVQCLQFLYQSHHQHKGPPPCYDQVSFFSECGKFCIPALHDIYIRDDGAYGAACLLEKTSPGQNPGDGAPGHAVFVMHEDYFKDEPTPPEKDGVPWKTWLREVLRIRENVRLVDWSSEGLSSACAYIEEHRPEKFLGYLNKAWAFESSAALSNPAIIAELQRTRVLCRGSESQKVALNRTYFPLKWIEDLCGRFMLDGEFFPWLHVEGPHSYERLPTEWEELSTRLGLNWNPSFVEASLTILERLHDQYRQESGSVQLLQRVLNLYSFIQTKLYEPGREADSKARVTELFVTQPWIIVLHDGSSKTQWVSFGDCVWDSPVDTNSIFSLSRQYSRYYQDPGQQKMVLSLFFSETLQMPDCTWEDLFEEVKDFKRNRENDLDRITTLYGCLAEMCRSKAAADGIKAAFEKGALVCGLETSTASWHKPSQCLWSTATQIRGMLVLNKLYSKLQQFFVSYLGVQTMTAGMVYEKLKSPGLSIGDAKETLLAFSSLLQTEGKKFDPGPILANEVFPVMSPNGKTSLEQGSSSFAIVDRKHLHDDFADKAKMLDFTMDEVLKLKALTQWCCLQDRYLSEAVKETTSADVNSTRPASNPSGDLRQKAHALLRIAAHFNSPRFEADPHGLYSLLRNSRTFETDEISSVLVLRQDQKSITVKKSTSALHIHEEADHLKIYLSTCPTQLEICLRLKLPRRLCEWILTESATQATQPVPPEMLTAVQSVVATHSAALDEILGECGIVPIDIPEQPVEIDVDGFQGQADAVISGSPTAKDGAQQRGLESSNNSLEKCRHMASNTPSPSFPPRVSGPKQRQGMTSAFRDPPKLATADAPAPTVGIFHSQSSNYVSLLREVARVAREATFPSKGSVFEINWDDRDWESGEKLAFLRGLDKGARDCMVGAAGELFVFELLSNLDPELPEFSRDNWQSSLRSLARAHPDYASMEPWPGRDASGIEYSDCSGALTKMLIEKGYLPAQDWANGHPRYTIKVKTTSLACATPFFVTENQYERIQQVCQSGPHFSPEMYIIFRVFDLTDGIGLKVLVNPEELRQQGELSFMPEIKWSVVAR